MKDVSGRKLKIGQKVKWGRASWSKLYWFEGVVKNFTPKSVKIQIDGQPICLSRDFIFVQDPENRIVILEK